MNDITLNWAKITKVLPAARKATEDRPYTTTEISKLLDKCDHRGRVVILLMCSSGIREGAIAPYNCNIYNELMTYTKSRFTRMILKNT